MKAAWAGNGDGISLIDAAHPQGTLCFVLRAVRNFVVERAQPMLALTNGLGLSIVHCEAEHFGHRLLRHKVLPITEGGKSVRILIYLATRRFLSVVRSGRRCHSAITALNEFTVTTDPLINRLLESASFSAPTPLG